MKKLFRKGMLALMTLASATIMSASAWAEDCTITIQTGQEGPVLDIMRGEWQVEKKTETGNPVEIGVFLLAELETIDGVPTYVVNEDYKTWEATYEKTVDFDFLNKEYGEDITAYNEAVREAMPVLGEYGKKNADKAVKTAIPNEAGNFVYDKLTPGWYIMAQTKGFEVAEVQPMLAPFPYKLNNRLVYILEAPAKYDLRKGALIMNKICSTEAEKPIRLEGAKFELEMKDAEGNWKQLAVLPATDANGQSPLKDLPLGIYRFREVTAPKGYKWDGKTVEFAIAQSGKIEVIEGMYVPIEGAIEKEFENEKANENTLEVTKKMQYALIDPETMAMLGIPIQVKTADIYVALFDDQACTNRVSDVKLIHIEGDDSGKAVFDNLEEGEVYYLAETDELGVRKDGGYAELVDQTLEYKPSYLWESSMPKVEAKEGENLLEFANNFLEWPRGHSVDGKLKVTKQVLNAQKQTVFAKDLPEGEKGIFYAGIFEVDENGEYTLAGNLTKENKEPVSNPVVLDLHKADQTTGIVESDMIVVHISDDVLDENGNPVTKTYAVMETDSTGKPIADKPAFIYDVDINGADLAEVVYSTDPESPALEYQVDIKNKLKTTVTPTPTVSVTPQITPTKPASSGGGGSYGGKSAVQTGDTTPWLAYVLTLVAAAVVVIGAVIFLKKRK